MKKSIASLAIVSFVALQAIAQPPAPRPGGNMPPPPAKPAMRPSALQEITSFNGQAGDWVANNDYVYDGFYLQTASDKMLVKFPPHLGQQLTNAVRKGSSITLKGMQTTNPEGVKEIHFVSVAVGGKTIADTGRTMAMSTMPTAETTVSANGKISELQKGARGEVNGFVLDNSTILRVPPHVAEQMSSLATAGNTISYTGTKKLAKSGEVLTGDYTIIHVKTITVNGKEYMVR